MVQLIPVQESPPVPKVRQVSVAPALLRPNPVVTVAAPAAVVVATPKTTSATTASTSATTSALAPVVVKPSTQLPAPVDPFQTPGLLPGAAAEAQDFSWQDMNISVGETLSLHFPKANWLYLDSPAQQKILGYQSTTREKDGTTFAFKPMSIGQYILEFQRQDLVTPATEVRHVRVKVAAAGTKTATTGTVTNPQSTTATNDAVEASRRLAAAGKTAEAVQRLLQNYREQDTRTNLEIARLLEEGNQTTDALDYLDKNLTLDTPDLKDSLVLGTRLAVKVPASQKLPAYVRQWLTSPVAPPEDVYLSVLASLKDQKLTTLAKDWLRVYDLWYKAPVSRDLYLFLTGNLLEAPGDLLNIKEAYKAYSELVAKYPLSAYWSAAGERASYLGRHFLQVR
ncbi:MAG: hypothetical protein WCG80_01570 [Spirochaetales bacterium]